MLRFINNLTESILKGNDITFEDATRLLDITEQRDVVSLISFANIIRNEFKASFIDTCAIINAKSGKCGEDCKFCSQSAHYRTAIEIGSSADISQTTVAPQLTAVWLHQRSGSRLVVDASSKTPAALSLDAVWESRGSA